LNPEAQISKPAWSIPIFRALWLANVGSGIGATMHDTAAVWTLANLTDKAWLVTFYQTLLSLPIFMFALPSGAMADLLDKRRFLFNVQMAGALIAGTMALLAVTGLMHVEFLLAGAFLLGCTLAFSMPAWQAMIPETVGKAHLKSAITLGGVGINISRAVGPFVGGYLVAATSAAPVFALNAVSFLGLGMVLKGWKKTAAPTPPCPESLLSAMVAAVRHVRYTSSIQRILWRHSIFAFAAFAPVALLPLIVQELNLPAQQFGWLLGIYGLGGMFGALVLLPMFKKKFSIDYTLLLSGLMGVLSLGILPFAKQFLTLAPILFIAGSTWLISMSQLSYAGQTVFPHWARARASAIQLLCVQGMIAMGSLFWGLVTEWIDLRVALISASGVMCIYLFITMWLRIDTSLAIDRSPITPDHSHEHLNWIPEPDDGPIRVSVQYHIKESSEEDFLKSISALKNERLRGGAYRWHLWRDLDNPRILSEVFLVGSWSEHNRQMFRATEVSRSLELEALSFHTQDSKPKVSHDLQIATGPHPIPY
jgi:MFS family permease